MQILKMKALLKMVSMFQYSALIIAFKSNVIAPRVTTQEDFYRLGYSGLINSSG